MASKLIPLEILRSWPLRKLQDLYQNALKHPDGQYYIDLIDEHDLLDRKNRSLDFNDPVYLEMLRIAKLDKFGDAAEAAASRNEPALSGIDNIFRDRLGEKYSDDYQKGTLMSAGYVVADVMRKRGYTDIGTGDCPEGCTAKKGLLWTKISC